MHKRKQDHIQLALKSKTNKTEQDTRFLYEPMLSGHPEEPLPSVTIAGKQLKAPLWISSMTGGTDMAREINQRLAEAAGHYGLGMGLGSCRILLEDSSRLQDFALRPILGPDVPFFANLGITQLEEILETGRENELKQLLSLLKADGLTIHVNPLQEWFQPEGDFLKHPPAKTLSHLIKVIDFPVSVKEVGQGMGPESLRELLSLKLEAIELGAFGGTNFAKVEMQRNPDASDYLYGPLVNVGNTADDMIDWLNNLQSDFQDYTGKIIASGGIRNYLDAYYFLKKSNYPTIVGMASGFLNPARKGQKEINNFVDETIEGLKMSYAFLKIR